MTLYALWQINSYTVTFDRNYLENNLYRKDWNNVYVGGNPTTTMLKSRQYLSNENALNGVEMKCVLGSHTLSSAGFWSRFGYEENLIKGNTYTWSVYLKCSSQKKILIGVEGGGEQNVTVTTEWQRFAFTTTQKATITNGMVFYLGANGSAWNDGDVLSVHSPELAQTNSLNVTYTTKKYNETLGTLSTPTRENYTFLGWYTAPVGGTRITSSKTVTGNVTYYAHWQYHKPNIGDYAMYDVPYTDIFNNEQYTSSNGWRILQLQQNASDSNKYDVKIISNGNPAGLYYNVSSIGNFQFDGTNGKWAANSTQRNNYANKFYASSSNDNGNMYAAAGLYYNLEKIIFKGTNASNAGYNYGYFTKINGQTPTSTTTGSIFRTTGTLANKITELRNVALSDVTGKTDASVAYTDPHNLFNYSNRNTSAYFWLASPLDSNDGSVRFIVENGGITASGDGHASIRPVITLTGVSLVWNDSTQGWNLK